MSVLETKAVGWMGDMGKFGLDCDVDEFTVKSLKTETGWKWSSAWYVKSPNICPSLCSLSQGIWRCCYPLETGKEGLSLASIWEQTHWSFSERHNPAAVVFRCATMCHGAFSVAPNWLTFGFKGTKFNSTQPTCSLVPQLRLKEQPKLGRIHTAGSSWLVRLKLSWGQIWNVTHGQ